VDNENTESDDGDDEETLRVWTPTKHTDYTQLYKEEADARLRGRGGKSGRISFSFASAAAVVVVVGAFLPPLLSLVARSREGEGEEAATPFPSSSLRLWPSIRKKSEESIGWKEGKEGAPRRMASTISPPPEKARAANYCVAKCLSL